MLALNKEKTRRLNEIALPLIVQNLSGMTIITADKAIIGRISPEAFNAVGVVGGLFFLLVGVLGFVSVQFNIFGGKALGLDDEDGFRDYFSSVLLLNVIIGVLLMAGILLFITPILSVLYGLYSETLYLAQAYANIMIIYFPIQLLLFSFSALLKIKRKTKWIMIVSLSAALVNLLLDFIFIAWLGFGIRVAAMTNIVAVTLHLLTFLWICRKELSFSMAKLKNYCSKMTEILKHSLPLMGQDILEGSVFTVVLVAFIARISDYHLAAYFVLVQFMGIALIPSYMYGSAVLNLLSQASGENDKSLIPKTATTLAGGIYLVLGVLFVMLRNYLPAVITDNVYVIGIAGSFMIFIVAARFFEVSANVYRYALQTLGESKFVLYLAAVVNTITVILMFIFVQVLEMGLHGAFICLFINHVTIFAFHKVRYKKIISCP